jgi:hypothetical protein
VNQQDVGVTLAADLDSLPTADGHDVRRGVVGLLKLRENEVQ